MPGDWLRTDLRGANAAAVRLVGQTQLTIGPGALVELISPKHIRIFSGDVKVAAAEKSPVEVTGPDKLAVTVKGTQLFRIEKEKLVRLERDPLWLKGFEGRVVGESIGSLVANIDGRNTPLTVGYHKVTVDIRDQIARTTVEESFVNHTNGRLEGVFHFPLPSDASISGFGMWIGSELVEADVVEKQRAREIYETILRERRDPGLLEWSGGNIFKARVFPIEAHSEKRIKITLHASPAATGQRLSLQLRPAERIAQAASAPRTGDRREAQFGGAAEERDFADASGARAADGPFGPGRVHGAGIHADAGFRGRGRVRRSAVGVGR